MASSRSAVRVEQLSIAAEPWRPALRTEEAAECSAPPVSSCASSNLLPAVLPNSSIDSLASLPSSAAVSVTVLRVVTMSLQSPGWLALCLLQQEIQCTFASICDRERKTRSGPPGDVPTRRKLHYWRQYLHFGVERLLPPRLSRTESSGGQPRAWCLPRSVCR